MNGSANTRRWQFALLCVLALCGVGSAWYWWQRAPEVPHVATDGLDAEVTSAIEQARGEVLAAQRSAAAWGKLGMVLFAHDMYGECPTVLAEAERLDPTDARWPYLRGLALILQNPDAGVAALERAAAISPQNLVTQLRLAEELLKLQRVDEAAGMFETLLAQQPANPRALLGQGQVLAKKQQWQEALAPLTKAAADPMSRRAARVMLAEAHTRLGNADAAEAERGLAAKLPADALWPDPILAEVERLRTGLLPRLEQALQLRAAGKAPEGLALLATVLRDHPNSDKAHLTHAKVLIATSNGVGADEALAHALRLNPSLAPAHLLVGQRLMAKKDLAAAEQSFERVTELTPADGLAHFDLGTCRAKQGKDAAAMNAFRQAVRCRPDLVAAHVELAALLLDDGQVAAAITHLQDAVRLDEKNERARAMLKRAWARQP